MSWLGELIGRVLAAPVRVTSELVKSADVLVDPDGQDHPNDLDRAASEIEKAGRRIVDGEEEGG